MMEEVGSHEGTVEQYGAAVGAEGTVEQYGAGVGAVISDALRDAAQTNVPGSKYLQSTHHTLSE